MRLPCNHQVDIRDMALCQSMRKNERYVMGRIARHDRAGLKIVPQQHVAARRGHFVLAVRQRKPLGAFHVERKDHQPLWLLCHLGPVTHPLHRIESGRSDPGAPNLSLRHIAAKCIRLVRVEIPAEIGLLRISTKAREIVWMVLGPQAFMAATDHIHISHPLLFPQSDP